MIDQRTKIGMPSLMKFKAPACFIIPDTLRIADGEPPHIEWDVHERGEYPSSFDEMNTDGYVQSDEVVHFRQLIRRTRVPYPEEIALSSFLTLEHGTPELILKFAQVFGPLNVEAYLSESSTLVGEVQSTKWKYSEAVLAYNRYSALFNEILRISAELNLGRAVPSRRLNKLFEQNPVFDPNYKPNAPISRDILASYVSEHLLKGVILVPSILWGADTSYDDLLAVGPVRVYEQPQPLFRIRTVPIDIDDVAIVYATRRQLIRRRAAELVPLDEGNPGIIETRIGTHRVRPLLALLIMQLMIMLTSEHGVYICDQCSNPFVSEYRKLRRDRKRLCSDDCRREAHLQHVRANYRKNKETNTA